MALGSFFSLFSSDHCPFRYDDEAGKLTKPETQEFLQKFLDSYVKWVDTIRR